MPYNTAIDNAASAPLIAPSGLAAVGARLNATKSLAVPSSSRRSPPTLFLASPSAMSTSDLISHREVPLQHERPSLSLNLTSIHDVISRSIAAASNVKATALAAPFNCKHTRLSRFPNVAEKNDEVPYFILPQFLKDAECVMPAEVSTESERYREDSIPSSTLTSPLSSPESTSSSTSTYSSGPRFFSLCAHVWSTSSATDAEKMEGRSGPKSPASSSKAVRDITVCSAPQTQKTADTSQTPPIANTKAHRRLYSDAVRNGKRAPPSAAAATSAAPAPRITPSEQPIQQTVDAAPPAAIAKAQPMRPTRPLYSDVVRYGRQAFRQIQI